MTEDRLRHILPEVERYRQSHPEAHISATILFSGAVSKSLQDRNGQTHIVDFVKDYIRRGVIEVGYDGTDEPTYDVRPMLKLSLLQSPQERWKQRQTVADEFLAEARDPLTGAPASGTGGLKEMQEVFGKAAYIKGLELALETYRPTPKNETDSCPTAIRRSQGPTNSRPGWAYSEKQEATRKRSKCWPSTTPRPSCSEFQPPIPLNCLVSRGSSSILAS